MLEALGLAHLRVKLGANLVEELIETGRVVGGDGPHTAMRVH
jgi:hypothetical protein